MSYFKGKYFEVVYTEDAAVAYFAIFAGGKDFDVSPTSVKFVAQRYAISEVENTSIRLPNV